MKKENILAKNLDFTRIIKNEKPIKSKNFVIYLEKTSDENYRFGFSVGKKIGKAVVRNKIKRQLKNIICKKDYKNGFNCIIIVRRSILNLNFGKMQEELLNLVEKLNITKENSNV